MVVLKTGDLFSSQLQTLVNTVNTKGVMGCGVALDAKKRFPEMFFDYYTRCLRKEVKAGVPYLYTLGQPMGPTKQILNFPTKHHWRNPSKYEWIEAGLKVFRERYQDWGITGVAWPVLGCGNGGLDRERVIPMMVGALEELPIDVEIYSG